MRVNDLRRLFFVLGNAKGVIIKDGFIKSDDFSKTPDVNKNPRTSYAPSGATSIQGYYAPISIEENFTYNNEKCVKVVFKGDTNYSGGGGDWSLCNYWIHGKNYNDVNRVSIRYAIDPSCPTSIGNGNFQIACGYGGTSNWIQQLNFGAILTYTWRDVQNYQNMRARYRYNGAIGYDIIMYIYDLMLSSDKEITNYIMNPAPDYNYHSYIDITFNEDEFASMYAQGYKYCQIGPLQADANGYNESWYVNGVLTNIRNVTDAMNQYMIFRLTDTNVYRITATSSSPGSGSPNTISMPSLGKIMFSKNIFF